MSRRHCEQLSNQLRAAIDRSGMTRRAICEEIGIGEATMSRFMARTSGLSFETLDKLGELLGLELVVTRSRKREER